MFDAKALLEQIAQSAGQQPAGGSQQSGLGALLGQIAGAASGAAGGIAASANENGIAGTLSKVLTEATQGVKDGARDSGLTSAARTAVGKVSGGQTPEDLVTKMKGLVAENQLATGAILGGLGGLMLGTKTGRELAGDAAKLGAAALIGGLAYRAYQNHKAGKPILGGAAEAPVGPAPAGSGFEPAAMSNETAVRVIRAMIAAAAADGRIDDTESAKIMSAFRQSGANKEAEGFLMREVEKPSSAADIARGVSSPAEAAEIYAAARIAIEPDSEGERTFLAELANELKIAPDLARQIDAAADNSISRAS